MTRRTSGGLLAGLLAGLLFTGLLVTGIMLGGCDTGLAPGDGLWADAPTRSSTISIGDDSVSLSLASRSLSETDRVFFRSSDIEFWQIESASDIGTLVSAKYVGTVDYALNHSLEYRIGNSSESIVFSPASDMTQSIDRPDLNPSWEDAVAAFITAEKTTINAMRLDIGAGQVTFIIDGEERIVYMADEEATVGLNCNSIFFVDEGFLSEPILITRDIEQDVISGSASAASLGISDSDFVAVNAIHTSSNWVDGETPIDVNGALILPMSPVDLTGFNPQSETLDVVVRWDIANAVYLRDGEYFMDDRVGGTSFDFEVQVIRGGK